MKALDGRDGRGYTAPRLRRPKTIDEFLIAALRKAGG